MVSELLSLLIHLPPVSSSIGLNREKTMALGVRNWMPAINVCTWVFVKKEGVGNSGWFQSYWVYPVAAT